MLNPRHHSTTPKLINLSAFRALDGDTGAAGFTTPQGRVREKKMPYGWWILPTMVVGALLWTLIIKMILRWVW